MAKELGLKGEAFPKLLNQPQNLHGLLASGVR